MPTMKAAVFYGPEDMRLEERPIPTCEPGGALVKIFGSLICGTDAKIYKNGHPKIKPPQIIGHEACGEIVEIRNNSYGLKVGDRVTFQTSISCGRCVMCKRGIFNLCDSITAISWEHAGTFAEYTAIPPGALALGNLVAAPASLSNEAVCLAEPLACVINGQELLHLAPGETVLIVGAGPIGIIQAELARLSGAGKVFISEISPERLKSAKAFEYDAYIDSSKQDVVKTVLELTGGYGVDIAIATAPVREPQEEALKTLAPRGRLSLFGSLGVGKSNLALDSRLIHYKELSVIGAASSSAIQIEKALCLLATGRIRTKEIVTHTLPLEKLVEGIRMAISGEALKVYIRAH